MHVRPHTFCSCCLTVHTGATDSVSCGKYLNIGIAISTEGVKQPQQQTRIISQEHVGVFANNRVCYPGYTIGNNNREGNGVQVLQQTSEISRSYAMHSNGRQARHFSLDIRRTVATARGQKV